MDQPNSKLLEALKMARDVLEGGKPWEYHLNFEIGRTMECVATVEKIDAILAEVTNG